MLHGDIPCQLRTITYINYQFHKLQKVMGPDLDYLSIYVLIGTSEYNSIICKPHYKYTASVS